MPIDENIGNDQALDEKRELRRRYRTLLQNSTDPAVSNDGKSDNSTERLVETLSGADELYKQVKAPYEAVLDAKVLVQTGSLAAQRVSALKFKSHALDVDDFVARLANYLGNTPDSRLGDLGALGNSSIKFPPSVKHILSPIWTDSMHRTRRSNTGTSKPGSRSRPDSSELQNPEDIENSDTLAVRDPLETPALVRLVHQILIEHSPIMLFRFVVHPHSFAQTVENIFYLSFLIRDGKAWIFDDENTGLPMVQAVEPATDEDHANGLTRKQAIMAIDMEQWQELVKTFNITEAMIIR